MTKPNLRNLGFVLFCLITFNVQTLKGQILETLHSFSFSDGSGPTTLLEGTDGNIYGTTSSGISGAIFRMNFTGSLSNLAFFERYTTGDGRKALIEGADGNFYGAANDGGSNLIGTIFKMTSEGALTTLHTFSFNESIARPTGALVQGVDGHIYGNAANGVFKISTNEGLTTLVNFANEDQPYGGLIQGSDGNFYGTISYGGTNYWGSVFKVTSAGVMTTLVSFNGTNGGNPFAGLLEASDGNFYGTTAMGGASNNGTVFRLTPSGELSTLISFNRTNGANPHAELIEASDGNLFGTTTSGGTNGGYGTVFKMSREGLLTTVFSFNGTNGSSPVAPLIQARDGNFYGTTRDGGSVSNPYGYGTIFRLVMPVGLKSRVGANELILSWPTNAVGFTIQSSTNLNSSANWTDSTNAPVVIDGQFTITNAILGSEQFYRLKK